MDGSKFQLNQDNKTEVLIIVTKTQRYKLCNKLQTLTVNTFGKVKNLGVLFVSELITKIAILSF